MAASLNDIYRTLGELTGTVKAINEKVDDLKRDMGDSEDASTRSRANVHRRLDEVASRTAGLETEMKTVKAKIVGMENVTDDVKALRQQASGAGKLGHWLIKLGIGIVMAAGWVYSAYSYMTGRPPP